MFKYYDVRSAAREAARCLLCHDAPCARACPRGVRIDAALRALRFENERGAALRAQHGTLCADCPDAPCMRACLRGKLDAPLELRDLAACLSKIASPPPAADLSIDFCGVPCENPFFLSSSSVGNSAEMIARAFDAGWAGVAYKTIPAFVPQEASPRIAALRGKGGVCYGVKNIEQLSDRPLEENLRNLETLKRAYPRKILIASIMGRDEAEWARLARLVAKAGADFIECNFSCPHMSDAALGAETGQNPALVERYTAAVKRAATIPVLAKMTPNLARMEEPARAAVRGGADGLAAINTIKSLSAPDPDSLSTAPCVAGQSSVSGYSGAGIKPIALRFIHDLKKDVRLQSVPLSGMGGIETWKDAFAFLSLGCENLQVTTAVMLYGYRIIEDLREGLAFYMAEKGVARLRDLVGCALPKIVSADALDRDTVVYPRFHAETCIGCGRCYISCQDAGHQAIRFAADKRRPSLNAARCVGCQLCAAVCPADSIAQSKRVKKPAR